MRVTNDMMVGRLLSNLQRTQQGMARLQDQMASGRRVLRPHHDPVGTATILRLNSNLTEINRYRRASEDALGWLSFTETALTRGVELVHHLREITIQAAVTALPSEAREGLASQVLATREHLLDLANSVYGERFVFSGHRTGHKPFEVEGGGGVIYHGDSGQQVRDLGPALQLVVNLPGDEVFQDLLEMCAVLADDVAAGNISALSNERMEDLDAELERLLLHAGTMGARHNRVSLSTTRMLDLEMAFTSLLTEVEDVDFARTVVNLQVAENVYQAALVATSRVLRPGLYEYLR